MKNLILSFLLLFLLASCGGTLLYSFGLTEVNIEESYTPGTDPCPFTVKEVTLTNTEGVTLDFFISGVSSALKIEHVSGNKNLSQADGIVSATLKTGETVTFRIILDPCDTDTFGNDNQVKDLVKVTAQDPNDTNVQTDRFISVEVNRNETLPANVSAAHTSFDGGTKPQCAPNPVPFASTVITNNRTSNVTVEVAMDPNPDSFSFDFIPANAIATAGGGTVQVTINYDCDPVLTGAYSGDAVFTIKENGQTVGTIRIPTTVTFNP